jgi:hypothetical protein
MKIRNGFVSNSSSSSFLVAIAPNVDLKSLFFKNLSKVVNEYSWGEDDKYFDVDEVVSVMKRNLKEVSTLDEMYEQMQGFCYYFDEYKDYPYGSKEYREIEMQREALEHSALFLFMKKYNRCKFYVGSFASDGGDPIEAFLRSSSIWKRVPFICSSE